MTTPARNPIGAEKWAACYTLKGEIVEATAVIPVEAVEAAAKAAAKDEDASNWDGEPEYYRNGWLNRMEVALEAAAPYMLSHESEQTRLAHLDAMVNRETKREELAAEYRRGYRDGLIDRKQVTVEPRDLEPGDPIE